MYSGSIDAGVGVVSDLYLTTCADMQKTPSISIAMTTFNGARYLNEQLESFGRQTVPPHELVVCDDGSTDETLSLLAAFSARCSFPVKVFKNERNLGFSDNFLKCASLCTGDWIAFSDQDDVWLPNKLERVSQAISEGDRRLVIVCHSALLANGNLELSGRRLPDYPKPRLAKQAKSYGFICIPGFTITFRASLLDGVDSRLRPRDYFDRRHVPISHDKWVPMLANLLGDTAYLPDSLAIYRRHESALSGSYDAQSPLDRIGKSLGVGHEYYNFQAAVAGECAQSLKLVADGISDVDRQAALLRGAKMYQKLADVCALRERIYLSASGGPRLARIGKLLGAGGYWGSRFAAYGTLSLAKDLYCCVK